MNLKSCILPALLALGCPAALLLSGCQATTQAVDSVRGQVTLLVDGRLPEVYEATTQAVEALKFKKLSSSCDALTGLVSCMTADQKKVDIRLEVQTPKVVRISIQVGAFGDERVSNALTAKIREILD